MFRFILSFLIFFALAGSCFPATITGTAKDSRGLPLVTLVYFTPTPVFPRSANPAVITTDTVKAQTASDGTFSVSLVTGSYVVTIAGKDRFTIYVPDSSSSYNWTTIQTSTNLYGVTDTAWLLKSGGVMSGHLTFNGGTNTLTVPSFTTAQRDAMSATNGMLIYNTTLAALQRRAADAWTSFSDGGTVTSVAVTSDSLTIVGSPITTSGTITIALPANLTGWNAIPTNNLTSTNTFRTFTNTLGTAAFTESSAYEVPLTFSAPLSRSVNTISIPASSGSVNGYLSSADWTTFNNKEGAITAGTTAQYWRGDKTWQTLQLSALSDAGTLASWALLPTNIFPSALTNTGNGATLINSSNAPGPWTLKSLTNDTNISLTATSTNISIGLVATAVTPGSYILTSITVDAYGRITAASNGSAAQFIASATGAGTNTTLTNATIITSARINLNPSSAATNFLVDCSTNQSYKILATNNMFLVFTNVPSTNSEVVINIQIMQDSTGGHSLTFGSATNCLWSGGAQPGITTNANRISAYTFINSAFTNGQVIGSSILNFQ